MLPRHDPTLKIPETLLCLPVFPYPEIMSNPPTSFKMLKYQIKTVAKSRQEQIRVSFKYGLLFSDRHRHQGSDQCCKKRSISQKALISKQNDKPPTQGYGIR